ERPSARSALKDQSALSVLKDLKDQSVLNRLNRLNLPTSALNCLNRPKYQNVPNLPTSFLKDQSFLKDLKDQSFLKDLKDLKDLRSLFLDAETIRAITVPKISILLRTTMIGVSMDRLVSTSSQVFPRMEAIAPVQELI
ncbi:MAG: hypothetical protein HC879_07430, partial [Leptolyngbyaceae cyanobacterium SL_5_9]|nr:hypothetical protein [Leptolyngbyaceae cyanobacterium SL_5_9]